MALRVFPTGVGVNRRRPACCQTAYRFPHRRGGEPDAALVNGQTPPVFPTGVGVNRHPGSVPVASGGFPHRRGGEPLAMANTVDPLEFSPQAWG